jgi:hypothetical protein
VATSPQDRSPEPDADVSPDVLEQRQRADGSFTEDDPFDDADHPLSPDEIEQRQEVVDPDDLDDERAERVD